MTDWFRSWHGAPTDPKWVLIGRKAGIAPAVASAIAWALFDHASQASPRGDVSGFDCEVYAAWGGIDDEAVIKAVTAMRDRGMIVDGILANWRKRQPDREDGSAERAKAWRERKSEERTQPNATERNQPTDTDTEEDKKREPKVSLSSASEEKLNRKQAALSLSKHGIKAKGETHEQRAETYLQACLDVPDIAFIEACERYRLGKVEKHNPKFAPTAGEFSTLARLIQSNSCLKVAVLAKPPPIIPNGKTRFLQQFEQNQQVS